MRWQVDIEAMQIVGTTDSAIDLVDDLIKWGFSFKVTRIDEDLSGPVLLHDQQLPQHNHAGDSE